MKGDPDEIRVGVAYTPTPIREVPARVGRMVLQMVLKLLAPEQGVELTLDDALARNRGKHIASAAMHRDPLLSIAAEPYVYFGHNWVVLAVATVPNFADMLRHTAQTVAR